MLNEYTIYREKNDLNLKFRTRTTAENLFNVIWNKYNHSEFRKYK